MNGNAIVAGRSIVTTAGTAVSLPNVPGQIPDDAELKIKALSGNSGVIWVGNSKLEAEDHDRAYPLEVINNVPDDISLKINRSNIYIDADNDGEGISWVVEILSIESKGV